ncbi:MAG: polysaccharide deacetylase family protein [Terriglobales bacterium]
MNKTVWLMSARCIATGLLLSLLSAAAMAAAPLRPNLRGEVMILVYHNFGKDARWSRSVASFDRDLARLDAAGYRPVTLRQYVSGDFALPAGATPVVLTFDDSSKFQVRFTPDGALDPDCALAHWVAFARTHPEFPVHGTFFINPGTDVFGQRVFIQKKLNLLLQLGSEIGNHTYDHPYLNKLSAAAVQREIGLGQYDIDRWLPGYAVTSFALPYGIAPRPDALAVSDVWTGPPAPHRAPVTVRWHYSAVVLVGSGPAASPLVAGLDGAHLPRIQVFHPEFTHWLDYFARHPERRFVSDGQRHPAGSLPRRTSGAFGMP